MSHLEDELAAYADEVAPEAMRDDPLLADLHTGGWLGAQEFLPLEWVVPGVVPEGASILVGGPKVGKSWLAYDIALAVASGGCALGSVQVEKRPVLLLALEDGDRRLKDRGRTILGDKPFPDDLHYVTKVKPNMAVATIEAWLRYQQSDAREPLILVDTFGKAEPPTGPEVSYTNDYQRASLYKDIADARPGMALVLLHHDRKARSEDFVQMVSGTNGIAGAFDTILMLHRKRNEPTGTLKVTGRDVAEYEYAVTRADGPWRLEGDSLAAATQAAAKVRDASLGEQAQSILDHVRSASQAVTPSDVADALGLERHLVQKYLTRLADQERICKPSRGRYARVGYVDSVDSADLAWPRVDRVDVTDTDRACEDCGTAENVVTFVGSKTNGTFCKACLLNRGGIE